MSILQSLDNFKIPVEDIKQATNNFSRENVVGPSGYGMVYAGVLLHSNVLTKIAAKRVDPSIINGEKHFSNEIRVLSSYKHVNIVSFIGFCDEHNEKILVQEFVAYRSLDKCLSNAKLKWMQRLQICIGAAHGLNYLHNGLEGHSVVHRDIRSRNILLDQNWQPQIARLGHSVLDPMHHHTIDEGIIGRPAYIDPTFLQTGVVTKESDIYSFGVVLFEVLCGRLAYETNENEKQFLGPLARLHYEERKLNQIIDPILREEMNPKSLELFSTIAYQCLEKNQSHRPTMIQVVQELEQVLTVQQEFQKVLQLQQVAHDLKRTQEDDICYKVKNLEHMKIPLEQIKSATRDFHDDYLIGRGGYGKVYKADLFHFDVQKYVKEDILQGVPMIELSGFERRRSTVAVKRLDRRYGQGTAEFLQEISVLPYFKHQNLVTLVGFCDEGHERILVSEYASNGSLEEYICTTGSKNNHTWAQRLQICLDAARGLEFLHNGVGEHHMIIHRDIKSSNILLGQNWVGKISDFGLSRIGPANLHATFVMTQVAGTLEYVDPQYHKTGMYC